MGVCVWGERWGSGGAGEKGGVAAGVEVRRARSGGGQVWVVMRVSAQQVCPYNPHGILRPLLAGCCCCDPGPTWPQR